MHCKVCLKLNAAYEDSVLLYRETVVRTRGVSDDECVEAIRVAVGLHDRAMDHYRELIAHLKAEHWRPQ
jgi:hypothetical protein